MPVRAVPATTWEAIGTRSTRFVTDTILTASAAVTSATWRPDELSNQPEIDRGD